MLHDAVVAVGVDAEVRIARGGKVDDGGENAVYVRVTGDAVDDAVGLIGEPGAVDVVVGGFGRWKEGEVRDKRFLDSASGSARNDKPSSAGDVAEEEGVIGKSGGGPLVVVTVGAHDPLGGLEDGPQGGKVSRRSRADYHLS